MFLNLSKARINQIVHNSMNVLTQRNTPMGPLSSIRRSAVTSTLPAESTAPFAITNSFGADFNIIRIVTEHAPKRVQYIQQETAKLRERIQVLELESSQLNALLAALTPASRR